MKDRTDFHCDDLLGADYGLLYRAGIRYLFFGTGEEDWRSGAGGRAHFRYPYQQSKYPAR